MRIFLLTAMIFVLSGGFVSAQGLSDMLTVDLAEDHVDITTGFNGARLTLFGVQEAPGSVAVVITGPKREMVVRQKQKIAGVWTNAKGMKFADVPSFYDYALSSPPDDLADEVVLKEHGIAMGALYFVPTYGKGDDKKVKEFQKALIRNKQMEGMFPAAPKDIVFLNDHFFRTSFYIPPNVPTGDYKIQTFLFQDGVVKDIKTTDVKVAQVGKSASIFRFAHRHSMSYGVLCVLFAMSVGWFSNAIRRRS